MNRGKKKTSVYIMSFALSAIFFLSSCSANKAAAAAESFFKALNSLDFTLAGELAGNRELYSYIQAAIEDDSSSYYEKVQYESFIKLVYKNVSFKVTQTEKTDDGYSVQGVVSVYAASDILACHEKLLSEYMQKEEYKSAGEAQKYVMLCEYIPKMYEVMKDMITKTDTSVTINIKENENGNITVVPEVELFDAIAGIKEQTKWN